MARSRLELPGVTSGLPWWLSNDAPGEVSTGEALIAQLATASLPDIIVSDLMMPGLAGTSLVRTLQATRKGCPLLLITTARFTGRERASLGLCPARYVLVLHVVPATRPATAPPTPARTSSRSQRVRTAQRLLGPLTWSSAAGLPPSSRP